MNNSGTVTGVVIHLPDSGLVKYEVDFYGTFHLSEQVDAQGHKLTFSYDSESALLTTITDADGNDTSIYYDDPVAPYYITRVVAPGGQTAILNYGDYYLLRDIVDAAGITNSLTYDLANFWPTSLTTPYGTTYFEGTYGQNIERWAVVTEPNGGRHAFMLTDLNPVNMPTNFASTQLPTNTPFSSPSYLYGGLDITNRNIRNTYYWNPQQVAAMGTTNFESFTWSEFKRGRIRHWLVADALESFNHVDTLGYEQSPSPDGTTEGQITWYDYDGKDLDVPQLRGTQVFPGVIARVMPDGSTWYQRHQHNSWGIVTNTIEKWHDGGAELYRTNSYFYAANGFDLLLHIGPHGEQVSSNIYNLNHQVTTNYDALNQATIYTYDATSRLLTSVARPSGLTTTNAYYASGSMANRLEKTIDLEINRTNSYVWGVDGNVFYQADERGLTVTNYWDGLNRLTGQKYPDGTTTTNLFTIGSALPNSTGGLMLMDTTATKDRLGYWTYHAYDSQRRLIATTNANGAVTRYGYCDCGAASSVTNAWGTTAEFVTSHDYDFQGYRIKTHYPDASITNWFDTLGRNTATGDAWGYTWYGYDNLNRRTSMTNGLSAVAEITVYDIDDHPLYVTDANGVTITNTYDELHRLSARTYPDGGVERFGYSARGLVAYTNQLNLVTRYTYDEASRKIAETNANTEVLLYTNNAAGDLLSLTDGKNQTTRWNYDEFGRVTNKLDQAGTEILRYKYDPDSRLTNRWSVGMGDTKYKYDPAGNLTNIDYAVSTDVRFGYDALNRVTNMVDAVGTTKYAYAAGGQLYTEDGPWSNDSVTNYYFNRLRTNLSLAQPTGVWTNKFGYDAARRLTSVVSPAGTFSYTLGAAGAASPLVKKLALPNTSYITNTHDGSARLLTTTLKNSSHTTLNSHTYAYNSGNQRTQQVFNVGSTYNYNYDAIGQLKVADSGTASEDRGYAYDTAWNLNYRTNNGTLQTFSVDGVNQLTNALSANYSYDLNGNMTNAAGLSYAYDDENRLALVSDDVGHSYRVGYIYDGLGRLRARQRYQWISGPNIWTATVQDRYLYDGWRVIQDRIGDSTLINSYTRGTDLSGSLEGAGGIGGLLGLSQGYSGGNWSTHNFYHADGNGNITYLVNSSQTVAASYRYDAFGNTLSSSGSLASANTYRFSSKMADDLSGGLYYYGFRWYAPNLQRWSNKDPLGERGGLNLYAFVENDPINEYDIDGRILGRRNRSSCVFWDVRTRSANNCTAAYATAAAVVCRTAGESPWEQCQRWCLQATYTTAGQNCCSAASTAAFIAATAARYTACAAACAVDAGITLPQIPPFPSIPGI